MDEFTILRMGHQGDGIAAGPVFAPVTLPGERVTGRLDGNVLREVRIVTPSDQRVAAPCTHFKTCGGCQLQHASDSFIASFKTDIVRKALSAHGLNTTFRPIQTSPSRTRRRAVFSVRRTKKGALAGFHARASDIVVAVPNCQLLQKELVAALPMVEALAITGASRKAELTVTVIHSRVGLDVSVKGGKPLDQELRSALAGHAETFRLARLHWDDETLAMRQPPLQQFGTAFVSPPPGSFLQATKHGEHALTAAVIEAINGTRQVVDLFCGSGTFTLPLARQSEIHAVDSIGAMLKALDHGWRQTEGLKKMSHEMRDLFRRPLLPDELRRFTGVVLDPPRAGAEAQIVEIAKTQSGVLQRIAYVSCNPVTFARDATVLVAAGFTLDWVQVVDQFRWSAHVELAAQFSTSA